MAGCSQEEGSGAPLPQGPQVINVDLSEYKLSYKAPVVQSGRVVFRVRNVGSIPHDLRVYAIDDDVGPILEQLRGKERRFVEPFGAVSRRLPGETGSFAVDLVDGQRYAMVCFLRDVEDGVVHAIKGMASEFRAGSRTTGPSTTGPSTTGPRN